MFLKELIVVSAIILTTIGVLIWRYGLGYNFGPFWGRWQKTQVSKKDSLFKAKPENVISVCEGAGLYISGDENFFQWIKEAKERGTELIQILLSPIKEINPDRIEKLKDISSVYLLDVEPEIGFILADNPGKEPDCVAAYIQEKARNPEFTPELETLALFINRFNGLLEESRRA